jgi:L-asparaginase/Glu-tRNA(Gln) amidotransferase subunit D
MSSVNLQADSSEELPRLEIRGHGGTIMSRIYQETASDIPVINPDPNAIGLLLNSIEPHDIAKFSRIDAIPSKPLIDSAQAKVRTILSIVAQYRKSLSENDTNVIMGLYGSDTAADLLNALGNAISKEELGNKGIIINVSMQHLDSKTNNAQRFFKRGLLLAAQHEVRGKIGLLYGERYFSPRGMEKVQLTQDYPFISRFHRMAKYETDNRSWKFRDEEKFDIPIGKKDKRYRLIDGVEEVPVTTTSNYSRLPKAIEDNTATILVAPGNGNLRTDSKSLALLRKAARDGKGPIIVVGRAIHNSDNDLQPEPDLQDAVYNGDATFIDQVISAGVMAPTEARILVSQTIADAYTEGITDKEAIFQRVYEAISQYPFLTLQQSQWKGASDRR